ncbi:phosphoglycerate kinase [Patescibacteria group bacterium]|nr:phosphoglycerate kinase [Patescibacteria group bacterium]MBU4600458.1 phosphoglycerate kinase [Patescibacteria group bacterium]MCG2698498.1 phosphoglycerate kinase [Candidatus Parcubacteria bacterium]
MKIKSIRNAKNIKGKRVFLRADFNVPFRMSDVGCRMSDILDDYKIISCLPTIRFLLRHKCKIIIATHLGRPRANTKTQKHKNTKTHSVKPIAVRLGKILGKRIKFVPDCIGKKTEEEAGKLKEGEIMLLENLRFHKEEEQNDKKFAKRLSRLADIHPAPFGQLSNNIKNILPKRRGVYVNNAFAASHRKHASLSAIKRYLPSYAGLLLQEELENLSKVLFPKKPLIVVIGGAKINTKIKLIKKLRRKASHILIGGALANNFFAAHGMEIGKSAADEKNVTLAKALKNKNRGGGANIILPIDVVVGKGKGNKEPEVKNAYDVKKSEKILDIGPKTIGLYSGFIKKANTIVWNGPMGMFEQDNFKHGTLSIARAVASRSRGRAFGIVGGGETAEALRQTKMIDYVDWVSTGGGAMLAFLSGEKMPGLKGIVK